MQRVDTVGEYLSDHRVGGDLAAQCHGGDKKIEAVFHD
jgi:hypothetical protein